MHTITIDLEAIEYLIRSLKPKDKSLLFQHLREEDNCKKELDKVTCKMRKTVQERGITDEEIDKICEEARREQYYEKKKSCL